MKNMDFTILGYGNLTLGGCLNENGRDAKGQ